MKKIDILKSNNVLVEESLEFWGDLESYNDNLKEFQESLMTKIESLEEYKNNQDLENYTILVHSIKSEAKYLGFMNEANIFLEHELQSKANNYEFIEKNFITLTDTIKKINNILDKYFSNANQKTILIVDDSNIMLNYLESNISDYKVIKANNGKEAIDSIKNNEIYAILLDLNMPSMNGFDVLEYLKQNELIEKLPVIVITGDDTKDTITKAFTYPILDVLNKPFTIDKIEHILVAIDSFYEKN